MCVCQVKCMCVLSEVYVCDTPSEVYVCDTHQKEATLSVCPIYPATRKDARYFDIFYPLSLR